MADIIRMPRLSDTMTEGVIKGWSKKVGDTVVPGDILAEVETDKATMDLEAFQEGTILHIAVAQGSVPVEGIIAIIGKKGEDISQLLQSETTNTESTNAIPAASSAPAPQNIPSLAVSTGSATSDRTKASPLAKNLAQEAGVDINKLTGSGEQGRIVKRDIEQYLSSPKLASNIATPQITAQGDEEVVLSQMRKTIARRLSESKFSAPHFYLTMEVNMDQAVSFRKLVNEQHEVKISYNDLVVKAVAQALLKHPVVNASWMGDKIAYHKDVHIGVAVAIEDGLVVPVIRFANTKSLSQLKLEIADKASRAKEKKLGLDEMQGNTFTISNLGMYDIDEFTAIINSPDSCILAVGAIIEKPIVKESNIVIGNIMKLCLSCDHRVVDGASGAKFLQTVKAHLEQPALMLY